MIITLASHDIDLCTRTVLAIAAGEKADVQTALAWTLRNRFIASARNGDPTADAVCRDLLREATGSPSATLPEAPASSEAEWRRALEINCLVWSGDLADPTNGATSCHRHDRTARWAARRVPTALIGAYIFLR
jgi:hypothetical protein